MTTDGVHPPAEPDQPRQAWIVPPDDEGASSPDVPVVPGRHSVPEPAAETAVTPSLSDAGPPTTELPKIPAAGDEPAWSGFAPDAFSPALHQTASGTDPVEEAAPQPGETTKNPQASHGVAGISRAERRRTAASRAPNQPKDRVRTVARGIGQTLITLGVVVLLFVVYEVYITDIFSAQKQNAATTKLDDTWQTPAAGPSGSGASGTSGTETDVVTITDPNKLVTDPRSRKVDYTPLDGEGFAKIYIPSFGSDFHYTVIEGTSSVDLETGPGHYSDSQLPGQPGNFAIAGHRVSKGSPFNALGQLDSCDAIIIETKSDWFVYRMLPTADQAASWGTTPHAHCDGVKPLTGDYAGVEGREITNPSDIQQVYPVPHKDSMQVPSDALRLITLTTCHPQFSDAQRMIVHGVLVKSYAKSNGFLPPELKES